MPIPSADHSLFIVGPTATGKTGLAVSISKQIPSLLISADSRQVYRGMDIVTGKDHPEGIVMAGVDIVNPDEPCSVAVWQDSLMLAFDVAFHLYKLPIYVGGTGLYLKSVLEPFPTIGIGIDEEFRKRAEKLSVEELQNRLRMMSPSKFYSMNNSDVNNPRRLVRAIEVAEFYKAQLRPLSHERPNKNYQLTIGLRYDDALAYESMIRKRVEQRIELGAIEETKNLLAKYDSHLPSMTAIGYHSIIKYIEGELTQEQLVDQWTREEVQYAKRQMTWFRKVPDIQWFDVSDADREEKIAKLVAKWYAKKEQFKIGE